MPVGVGADFVAFLHREPHLFKPLLHHVQGGTAKPDIALAVAARGVHINVLVGVKQEKHAADEIREADSGARRELPRRLPKFDLVRTVECKQYKLRRGWNFGHELPP
jgi:hypothetical protein